MSSWPVEVTCRDRHRHCLTIPRERWSYCIICGDVQDRRTVTLNIQVTVTNRYVERRMEERST